MPFVKAEPEQKRGKLLLWGPPGCFKTRTMLRLGHAPDGPPQMAVVDSEFGTDWYAGEFNFEKLQSNNPDEIFRETEKLIADPGEIRVLGLDTISVWYDAIEGKFAELFLKREIGGKGHKQDYYTFQPRDYTHLKRAASKMIRMLLASDLHIIGICQTTEKWSDLKVVGTKADGPKRLEHWFDIIIEIQELGEDKFQGVVRKDRSHKVGPRGTKLKWENDAQVCERLAVLGFTGGPKASGVVWRDVEKEAANAHIRKSELFGKIKQLKDGLGYGPQEWTAFLKPFRTDSVKGLSPEDLEAVVKELEARREQTFDQPPAEETPAQPEQPREQEETQAQEKSQPTQEQEPGDSKEEVVAPQTMEEPPSPPEEEPAAAEAETPSADLLLKKVVELKRELKLTDRQAWDELVKPYGVESAKEMRVDQLKDFIMMLESLRPTEAPSG